MDPLPRHYALDAEANALLRQAFDARAANAKKARRYAKKHFGSPDVVMTENSTEGVKVIGIACKEHPGTVWKIDKKDRRFKDLTFYYPKATKPGKEIAARLKTLGIDYLKDFRQLVGFTQDVFENVGGLRFFRGGFSLTQVNKSEWILILIGEDKREPQHATRISDIEFEEKIKSFEKTKKAARK